MEANINEILGLIKLVQPKVLDELGNKFPKYHKLLKPGKTLGTANEVKDRNEILVRAEVCISGLQVALKACDMNLPKLKKQLKNLGNIQFISQLIVGISGAALLSQNQEDFPQIKLITGLLALCGSILTLYTQHKSGTLLNNAQSIFVLYDKLVDNKFEAELLRQEIDIEVQIFDEMAPSQKLSDLINQANKICLEIRKTLEKI